MMGLGDDHHEGAMGLFAEGIRTLLQTGPSLAPGNRFARVVGITTRKGGVGKTTLSLNLAATLASEFHKKVLLVDLDPQGHAKASSRSLAQGAAAVPFSELLLDRKRELLEAVVPTALDNLYMVHADDGLNDAEGLLSTKIGKEFTLRNLLRITRTHFDLILLDTPPNLGNLTVAALVASDFCLLPLDLSSLALQGVEDILEAIETIEDRLGHQLSLAGLVVNRFDKRLSTVNAPIQAELARRYGDAVLGACIPSTSAIQKAQFNGLPLVQYDPKSTAAEAFRTLAREVLARIG
jgi:chromosome partitioning protein